MPQQPERVHGLLAAELRAAPPVPSDELRDRVAVIAARVPPLPEPSMWQRWTRRATLALAPVAVVTGVVALVAVVPSGGDETADEAAATGSARRAKTRGTPELAPNLGKVPYATTGGAEAFERDALPADRANALSRGQVAVPPSGRRLQEYRATLRVRVSSLDDLSPATTRAMRITRTLGGYVVRADFGAAAGAEGDSVLVVRVPVGKVSEAVLRFSELGSVASQQVSIADLQQTFNAQTDRVTSLRSTVAALERDLRRTDLTPEQRERLRTRLANARTSLEQAIGARLATQRRGRLAQVSLTLTTREGAAPVAPSKPGRFEQTLRDALGLLAAMLTWLLAALIVAGPFLALAAVASVLERRRRRRSDRMLLEQTG
jgi:hypothetical protein